MKLGEIQRIAVLGSGNHGPWHRAELRHGWLRSIAV